MFKKPKIMNKQIPDCRFLYMMSTPRMSNSMDQPCEFESSLDDQTDSVAGKSIHYMPRWGSSSSRMWRRMALMRARVVSWSRALPTRS